MTSQQIRQKFLHFFEDKKHLIVSSAPIVLKDDPTLMFSNSGMTQFKDYFLGYKEPKVLRIANIQKCLRVSGKHNDLDDVGRDTYHHTMFEMLGNWSFGDYFKKDAISWAWELLTEVYKIPKDSLYVTIFGGDISENLERDNDAYVFWKEHIAEDRIIDGNKKDNFWEMGESGPCGPCSEIHVDLRSDDEKLLVSGKDLVNQDHPQVVEIWNLVFMEFNRKADGVLEKLPARHVDTGMGFERLCMVLQGKSSNYDTDIFSPLIKKVEQFSGKRYTGLLEDEKDIAIRVVVDHIRAVAFAIADGQLPSNVGSGYVIRRILRRAVSYSYRFLGMKEAFLYKLVNTLKNQMGNFFPEILKQERLVCEVIKEEENAFLKTIEKGMERLEDILKETIEKGEKLISGGQIFELYDTFGFPVDLSRIIAEEQNLSVDQDGFEKEMEKQKQRSKKNSAGKVYDWIILKEEPEIFIGYDNIVSTTYITRYRKIENKNGNFYQIVLAATPFYPQGGGQVGDTGFLLFMDNDQNSEKEELCKPIRVLDTKKENNLIVSLVEILPENLENKFIAKVDKKNRQNIQANHSVTHLLHEALREVLGTHVEQRGSFVGSDYLRFDFSHFSKMTMEEIKSVEKRVNNKIQENIVLKEFRQIPIAEAMDKGAIALFGEKYGDIVRMIQFGSSIELCGGTHVKSTGEIGYFKIMSENSVAAGIRRIEAISGAGIIKYFEGLEEQFEEISQILKQKNLQKSVKKLLSENQSLKAEIEIFKKEKNKNEILNWKNDFISQQDKNLLVKRVSMDSANVKDIVFTLKKEFPKSLIIVISDANDKPVITVGVSENLQDKYHAGDIVKELVKEIQGGGGGNAGFATAGGKNLEGIDVVLKKAKNL